CSLTTPAPARPYTRSLHDALPIFADLQPALHHGHAALGEVLADELRSAAPGHHVDEIGLLLAALGLEVPVHGQGEGRDGGAASGDRKSTRLNSSHVSISYAVFCLK